jgi:hypothetical protein
VSLNFNNSFAPDVGLIKDNVMLVDWNADILLGGNRDGSLTPLASALGYQGLVTLRGWRLTTRILFRDTSVVFDCSDASQVGRGPRDGSGWWVVAAEDGGE